MKTERQRNKKTYHKKERNKKKNTIDKETKTVEQIKKEERMTKMKENKYIYETK